MGQGMSFAYANFANGPPELVLPEGGKNSGETQVLLRDPEPAAASAGGLADRPSYQATDRAKMSAHGSQSGHSGAALVDTHRVGVQAVVGSVALRLWLSVDHPPICCMVAARSGDSIGLGRTAAIDGVDRSLALLRGTAVGIAVVDSELYRVAWTGVAAASGVAAEVRQERPPLNEFVRQQANASISGAR